MVSSLVTCSLVESSSSKMDYPDLVTESTGLYKNPEVIVTEQFVTDVVDFSSQYGSDISISYTAYNISGKPSKYPDYGDFPQAFVMRTYGNWWAEAPSRRETFMPQNFGKIISHDYIDVKFENPVYPFSISIYETYNPGSVVRIWAGLADGKWELLWEGEAQECEHQARKFSPKLRFINSLTSLIRLEFDHSRLEYYTELDAISLTGTNVPISVQSQRTRVISRCNSSGGPSCSPGGGGGGCGPTSAGARHNSLPMNVCDGETATSDSSSSAASANETAANSPSLVSPISDLTEKIIKLNIHAIPPPLLRHQQFTSSDSDSEASTHRSADAVQTRSGGSGSRKNTLSEVCDILLQELEESWWSTGIPPPLPAPPHSASAADGRLSPTDDSQSSSSSSTEQMATATKASTGGRENSGPFACLPDETLLYIFSFLDLVSLSNCCRVNRHFHSIAMDSLLYTELNLKPYWSWMSLDSLYNLSSRCQHLIKLDLSWCFNYCHIPSNMFTKFIQQSGKTLAILRLDCCKFIDDSSMQEITATCRSLKELTLKNCSRITKTGFESLAKLGTLERLDLYRTTVETLPLVKVLKASPRLKHLNLGLCVRVSSMDEVAQVLGTYNRELVTIDFWKTYSLTPVGVRALSHCSKLEEVDLGWCLGVSVPGDCMTALATGCPRLRKLFMAALRAITDRDLYPFVSSCPNLQQLDLLGLRIITADICLRFLNGCKDLRLLDVSFCDQIQEAEVIAWRTQFPKVSIKRSFQGGSGCYLPNHY